MLQKSEPRREMHLALADLINALGGYKIIAGACMVSPESVNKWKQSPTGNGQVIPLIHFQTLLAMVGDNLTNLAAQNACDEILQDHLLGLCFRRAYPEEKVFAVVEMLSGGRWARERIGAVDRNARSLKFI